MSKTDSWNLPLEKHREGFKKLAIELACRAGGILVDCTKRGFAVRHKQAIDLVTDADYAAEEAIVQGITGEYRDHAIVTEEQATLGPRGSEYRWLIDPLDGTVNFAHGLEFYCVSIALEYCGRIILAVVFDPCRQELFLAELGKRASVNGRTLKVSDICHLSEALIGTGFAYDIREAQANNLDHFAKFSLRAQSVRRLGAAALDLCYVAAGRLDGFWELQLKPWDMAAASLLVQEAGGTVSDVFGHDLSIYGGGIIASNGHLHQEMLSVLMTT